MRVKYFGLFAFLFLLVLIDRAAKGWGTSRPFFDEHLNPNIFLNLNAFNVYWSVVLILFIFILVLLILRWAKKTISWFLVLILAGALSNLFDRFKYGGVIDYINVGFLGITINIADLYIVFGIVMAVLFLIKNEKITN